MRVLLLVFLIAFGLGKDYSFKVNSVGKGNPVILIPGLACDGSVWDETVEQLKNNHKCYVLTLPGFSKQPPIKTQHYIPEITNQLAQFIKENCREKPIIIGHSLGGIIAMNLGINYSESIAKIIIVDAYPFLPALFNPNVTPEQLAPQINFIKKSILESSQEQFEKQQRRNLKMMISSPEKIEIALKWSLDSNRETIANAMAGIFSADLRNDLDKIQVPTLVLISAENRKNFIENAAKKQYEKCSKCTLKFTDKAKHFIMWDDFEWFYKNITEFINEK